MLNLRRSSTAIIEWCVLSGPAILRISILLLIAGVLAALVQYLLPPDPPVTAAEPPRVERRAEPEPAAPPDAPAPASPAPAAQEPARRADPTTSPARMPTDALAFPPPAASPPATSPPSTAPPVPAASPSPRGEGEIAQAEDNAGPRALALVDLNTASLADLNRLQGGGAIGRAIVSKRPYASIDQLLGKRVLSRAVYDRIKAQVTVR